MLLVGGKGSAFTDGAQITTEDKAIVGTGGSVFTSSPTASITRFTVIALLFYLQEKETRLLWPNSHRGGLKPRDYGSDETDETHRITLTVYHLQMYKINLWLQCRPVL